MPDWVMRAAGAPGAGEIPLLAAAADGSGDVVATIAEDGPLGLRLQGTDPPPPVAGEPPALPDTLFVESVAPGSLSARVGIAAGAAAPIDHRLLPYTPVGVPSIHHVS